jgi:hypothetical protein
MIHTKQTVTTFPETRATNVTIGVGAHPAQEGGGDANKHPASGSLAVSVCFFISILCQWPRARRCSFHRRKRSRGASRFEGKEFRLLHRSLGKRPQIPSRHAGR